MTGDQKTVTPRHITTSSGGHGGNRGGHDVGASGYFLGFGFDFCLFIPEIMHLHKHPGATKVSNKLYRFYHGKCIPILSS
jgi:hypothetical protein